MQHKTFVLISLFFILATLPFTAFAQYEGLPKLAIGLSAGYETGTINDQDIDGLYLQARLGGVFKTYPIVFVGLDEELPCPVDRLPREHGSRLRLEPQASRRLLHGLGQ